MPDVGPASARRAGCDPKRSAAKVVGGILTHRISRICPRETRAAGLIKVPLRLEAKDEQTPNWCAEAQRQRRRKAFVPAHAAPLGAHETVCWTVRFRCARFDCSVGPSLAPSSPTSCSRRLRAVAEAGTVRQPPRAKTPGATRRPTAQPVGCVRRLPRILRTRTRPTRAEAAAGARRASTRTNLARSCSLSIKIANLQG
jgi:hypothetical protein